MTARVFITGGASLLGLNWALTIRQTHSVTLGLHQRRVVLSGVALTEVSLESVDDVLATFDRVQPNIVVHTAGLTNVEECEADPALAHHLNVDLSANVAEACARSGCVLVHISTDHLFSSAPEPVSENYPVHPRNVYGRTKAEAEVRVLDRCPAAMVVRTNFYGWGPSYRRSFSDVIIEALRAGRGMTLFDDVHYTPLLMEVLVDAVQDLVGRGASGVLHVASDERLSKYQFGMMLADEFGLDAALLTAGSLADRSELVPRPHGMSLSNARVRALLGRELGTVANHLGMMRRQELEGRASEIQRL
jgi:dTDP-4-dehydrorhamnose reductase